MDAHRDIGEVPEEEWQHALHYADILARRQWMHDGMITGEDVYHDMAMDVFCECYAHYDSAKGVKFAQYFWINARYRLRGVRRDLARVSRYDQKGAEQLYPRSRTFAWDDAPVFWAQILARLPTPRHRNFLLRLLAGERAADIAKDEGRTESAMHYRLAYIVRVLAQGDGAGGA